MFAFLRKRSLQKLKCWRFTALPVHLLVWSPFYWIQLLTDSTPFHPQVLGHSSWTILYLLPQVPTGCLLVPCRTHRIPRAAFSTLAFYWFSLWAVLHPIMPSSLWSETMPTPVVSGIGWMNLVCLWVFAHLRATLLQKYHSVPAYRPSFTLCLLNWIDPCTN